MDELTYTLRGLCLRNRDGSHATQADRLRTDTRESPVARRRRLALHDYRSAQLWLLKLSRRPGVLELRSRPPRPNRNYLARSDQQGFADARARGAHGEGDA